MTANIDFVHLHLHSEYSLLDGAIRFDRLASYLTENGMNSVAVTDHGSLFGAVQFFEKMTEKSIHAILGMEAYLAYPSMTERSRNSKRYHLTIIARNETGYHNLSKLSSAGYIDGFYYKPRIDRELLADYSEGLLIGSACLQGEVAQHLLSGRREKAIETIRFYQEIVGRENFFIELMDHGLNDEKIVLPLLAELAKEMEAPVAATNDAHYLRKSDHEAHEALLCLQTGKTLDDPSHMRFDTAEFYVKTPLEMQKLFGWIPEAVTNTVNLAEKCDFELTQGDFLHPEFPLPDGKHDMQGYLKKLSYEGLANRLERKPETHELERLDYELGIIRDMGFPGYFLVVSELMRWARSNNIPVGPGRGSTAGSLVSYAVDITDINPLDYDLSFERFLNPARKEMPDIDLDVCCERRGEIIDHIIELYGRENVCQLITFSRIRNRSVVRDMARVMGMSVAEGDALAKLVASAPNPDAPLPELVSSVPELSRMVKEEKKIEKLFDYGYTLENLARHSGVHAAGVIIAPGNLREFVPLYSAKEGITTQYEKKSAEKVGLLKLDLLGLRNVTIIHRAQKMIRRKESGLEVKELPFNDPETLELIGRGETAGVFQLESSGMREALRKIDVNSFDDVVAAVAIFRPGSMDMIDLYADNKKGIKSRASDFTITYPHPDLEEVLSPTYGVIIYQEQVMRIANLLAGMSMAEADILRRAMSRKDPEVMAQMREKFTSGAVNRGVNKKTAKKIFDLIEKFAGYGFNKSHAVCYAALAYWTAWLKVHHPSEFLAACLTSEIGKIEKITRTIDECNRIGVIVNSPSVNASSVSFDVDEKGKIIYALAAIKNVGEGPSSAIVEERKESGEFKNIFDFCTRLGNGAVNKKTLESLIGAGAMDCFGVNRATLLDSVEHALNYGAAERKHAEAGQMSLFQGGAEEKSSHFEGEPVINEKPELQFEERCSLEKSLLGFYMTGHPLEKYSDEIDSFATDSVERANESKRSIVTTAGMIMQRKIIPTKRGDMAFILVEGRTGTGEVVVFNDALQKYSDLLEPGRLVLMDGEVSRRRGDSRLSVRAVFQMDDVRTKLRAGITIRVDGNNPRMKLLQKAVGYMKESSGNGEVSVDIKHRSGWRVKGLSRSIKVYPDNALMDKLRELLGRESVILSRGKGPRI
ncbi:MAG: DNA polymerase III subunit alpha [Candidatus Aegiribacteria sp.]|nr:DNA polymerase III subunit alpha [Candidatus Aegiribacteria sp.]